MAQISFRAFHLWCHQSKSAVCVYTGESSSCRVDTAIIQKRLPVLHKYLNSDTERQLQALYALQALIVKLDQPPSEYKLSFQLCSILRPCLPSDSLSFIFCVHAKHRGTLSVASSIWIYANQVWLVQTIGSNDSWHNPMTHVVWHC